MTTGSQVTLLDIRVSDYIGDIIFVEEESQSGDHSLFQRSTFLLTMTVVVPEPKPRSVSNPN